MASSASAAPRVTWKDLAPDIHELIIRSSLKDGSVASDTEKKAAGVMRLVCSDWAQLVCEIVRVLSWDPKSGDGAAAQSMEFILRLRRMEELRLNTSKADAAAPVILTQLNQLSSLRSLHLDHTEAGGGGQATLDHLAWIQGSSLTDFRINWGPNVSSAKLQEFLQSLPKGLMSFDIACGNPPADVAPPYGLSSTQLTSLKLKGLRLDTEALGGFIGSVPHLQQLTLSDL